MNLKTYHKNMVVGCYVHVLGPFARGWGKDIVNFRTCYSHMVIGMLSTCAGALCRGLGVRHSEP